MLKSRIHIIDIIKGDFEVGRHLSWRFWGTLRGHILIYILGGHFQYYMVITEGHLICGIFKKEFLTCGIFRNFKTRQHGGSRFPVASDPISTCSLSLLHLSWCFPVHPAMGTQGSKAPALVGMHAWPSQGRGVSLSSTLVMVVRQG